MNEEDKIEESVQIDGRTKMYKETVARLEQARKLREERRKAMRENKYEGLYDDGSGKGAFVPEPITIRRGDNMESKNTVTNSLKMVEMYKKLREEKKKTLMGAKKESVETKTEETVESKKLTRGQIMDAIGMSNNGKFEVSEEELSPKQKAYRAFFEKALKKFGKKSPADMDDGEKKKFFDYVKANWKG